MTTITMPQLGETVTEGTVAQWLKKPGDAIEKYESFVEVSTDKVNAEVPSPVSGVLREIICKEGETVATGAPIAIIDEVAVAGAGGAEPSPVAAHAAPAAVAAAPAVVSNGAPRGGNGSVNTSEVLRGVSPAVRRLAREHHVDVSSLRGTGHNGRVTANDVLAAASRGPVAPVVRGTRSRNARTAFAGAQDHRAAHGRIARDRPARVDDGRSRRQQRLGLARESEGPLPAREGPAAHALALLHPCGGWSAEGESVAQRPVHR
jgi:2-oxoisovalerate dehydrogenase E2 component (dihydrolipoyl transacylase)